MSVTVLVPASLQTLSNGESRLIAEGHNLRAVIADLARQHPRLAKRLRDEDRLGHGLSLAINGDIVSTGLITTVADGAEIAILPQISGGTSDIRKEGPLKFPNSKSCLYHLSAHITSRRRYIAMAVAFALIALISIASRSVLPSVSADDHESTPPSAEDSPGHFLVSFHPTRAEVLPGDTIGYSAIFENNSDEPISNLVVSMTVTGYADALTYLEQSTVVRCAEDAETQALPDLEAQPMLICGIIAPRQKIRLEWKLRVSECALQDRWVQVNFLAEPDSTLYPRPLFVRHYIAPHPASFNKHFTVTYDLNTSTPAPGEPVHHTVRVANTGNRVLDDVVIHLQPHESLDQFLPTISENSHFFIISQQGSTPGPTRSIDPRWSDPSGRFTLDYLNPGDILVMRWTDYVAENAPIDVEVSPHVAVRTAGAKQWTQAATRFTVANSPTDLVIDARFEDTASLLGPFRPGEATSMIVTITNHTDHVQSGLALAFDLPVALTVIDNRSFYEFGNYVDGNARQVPAYWINQGFALPNLPPSEQLVLHLALRVQSDVVPTQVVRASVRLHSESEGTKHSVADLYITPISHLDLDIAQSEIFSDSGTIDYEIKVSNSGETELSNVVVSVEVPCGLSPVGPYNYGVVSDGIVVWTNISSDVAVHSDGGIMLDSLMPRDPLAERDLSTKTILLSFRVDDDSPAGAQPGLRVNVIATGISSQIYQREETTIIISEPVATSAQLSDAQDEILSAVEGIGPASEELLEEIGQATSSVSDTSTQIQTLAEDLEMSLGDLETFQEDLIDAQGVLADATDQINNLVKDVEEASDILGDSKEDIKGLSEKIEDASDDLEDAGGKIDTFLRDNLPAVLLGELVGAVLSLWLFWHVRSRWAHTAIGRRQIGSLAGGALLILLIGGVASLLLGWRTAGVAWWVGGIFALALLAALVFFCFATDDEWSRGRRYRWIRRPVSHLWHYCWDFVVSTIRSLTRLRRPW